MWYTHNTVKYTKCTNNGIITQGQQYMTNKLAYLIHFETPVLRKHEYRPLMI